MFREVTKSHNIALDNAAIHQTAPSVFATQPFNEVSEKYGFIPTVQVVDELRNHGWMPVDATQKNVRNPEKIDFTKHLIRFRRLGDDIQVGDSVVELLLTNSHDRSSGFVLHAGVFRMACANGIVIADNTFQKVSVRHSKHAVERVVEGSYSVIDEVPLITNEIESMQNIDLSQDEQRIMAKAALTYMEPNNPKPDAPRIITPENAIIDQMLQPKRASDTGSDLWSTFNVIQEKALRGGVRIQKMNKNNRVTRTTTREVKAIDKSIKLNKALFQMATQMRELKKMDEAA